jgi:hypothetical protein
MYYANEDFRAVRYFKLYLTANTGVNYWQYTSKEGAGLAQAV